MLRDYFPLVAWEIDETAWDTVLEKYQIDTVFWVKAHEQLRRFLIDKRGFGDERVHGLARMLDRALKTVHSQWQADNPDQVVEGVEIKRQPPRITWTRDGQMKELVSGQFAKLPREMLSRFEEFKATTILNDRRISEVYRQYKDESVASVKPAAEPVKLPI